MRHLDWQHVVLFSVGAGCATAVILLGHGGIFISALAGVGGLSGVLGLLKGSPLKGASDATSNDAPK